MMRFESVGQRWPGLTAVRTPPVLRRHWGWALIIGLTTLFLFWLFYHRYIAPAWLYQLPPLWQEGLNLLEAAAAFTLSFVWLGLWWRAYRGPSLPPAPLEISRDKLYDFSPLDFEQYVANIFRRRGYEVHHRGGSGDAGVDLELTDPAGRRGIVQVKRYQNNIGPEIIRELFGTMLHERVTHAFLVTTADISTGAREWAADKPMTLIDGATLVRIAAAQQDTPAPT